MTPWRYDDGDGDPHCYYLQSLVARGNHRSLRVSGFPMRTEDDVSAAAAAGGVSTDGSLHPRYSVYLRCCYGRGPPWRVGTPIGWVKGDSPPRFRCNLTPSVPSSP